MNDILTTEAALFAKLENAAKHHCVRTARARIRDIARLRHDMYGDNIEQTIQEISTYYNNMYKNNKHD